MTHQLFEKGANAPKCHLLYWPSPGLSNEKPDQLDHQQKIVFEDIGFSGHLPRRLSARAHKKRLRIIPEDLGVRRFSLDAIRFSLEIDGLKSVSACYMFRSHRQTGSIARRQPTISPSRERFQQSRRKTMGKDDQEAPDLTVTLSDNATKRLSEFWQERPLVLVFLRHFG